MRSVACIALIAAASVAPAVEHGLIGRYFTGKELVEPAAFEQVDAAIDFDWGSGSPAGLAKPFSARWRGQIVFPTAGTWTFTANSDDGIVVTIDDHVVVADWSDHPARESSGDIAIDAPGPRWIDVAWYDQGGLAVAQLDWTGPGVVRQRVPTSALLAQPRAPQAIVIPASSPVSPLTLDAWPTPGVVPTVKVGGHPVAAIALSSEHAVIEATLDTHPVPVSIDVGAGKVNRTVTWSETTLTGDAATRLRAGDSLLLGAPVAGTVRVLPECGSGDAFAVRSGASVPYRFADPGRYIVELRDRGNALAGRLTVDAVGVAFPLPIADQVGYVRRYHATVTPDAGAVWFGSDDPGRGAAWLTLADGSAATLRLVAFSDQPVRVVARLGGAAGPLLGVAPISAYRLLDNSDSGYVIDRDELGFGRGQYVLRMKPRVPGELIDIVFFTGAATINGQGHLVLRSDDLAADGTFIGDLVVFPGAVITCHAITVFEELP